MKEIVSHIKRKGCFWQDKKEPNNLYKDSKALKLCLAKS